MVGPVDAGNGGGNGGGRDGGGNGGGRDGGGNGGGRDASAMDMGGRPGRDAGGGMGDAGPGIASCVAGTRCRSANPEPTCMAMCPGGAERTCQCTVAGVVRCAACPRPDAGGGEAGGGGGDAGGGGGDAGGAGACPAGVATGQACMPNGSFCTSMCPTGNRTEACACRNGMWTCFNRCP